LITETAGLASQCTHDFYVPGQESRAGVQEDSFLASAARAQLAEAHIAAAFWLPG